MSARAVAVRLAVCALAATTAAAPVVLSAGTAGAATRAASAPVSAPVVSRGVTLPAFYTPPATLPAAPGTLVRSGPLTLALVLPGLTGPLPGRATRIMYTTTDAGGGRAAVTGAYLEPTARWQGPGARPLVVLAPGTMGQGDQCSASLGLERGLVVGSSTVSVGYENLAAYRLLAQGIAVVVTDYLGLGTTDRLHTYVNRLDEGHAVLDAARAAHAVPGASITPASPVGFYGYSQGGGAVASAAELQPAYAPDVPVRATYSGAPPADLAQVTAAIDGTELAGALAWAVNGFVQTEPALQPLLDRYLSPYGRTVLEDLSTACVGDAIAGYANKRSTAWTTTGTSLASIIAAEPVLRDFVGSQLIGTHRPVGAVRLATGVEDDLVPHAQARELAVRWCALGGDVAYVPVAQAKLSSPLLNHFGALLADQQAAVTWIAGRLAGGPSAPTCSTISRQP